MTLRSVRGPRLELMSAEEEGVTFGRKKTGKADVDREHPFWDHQPMLRLCTLRCEPCGWEIDVRTQRRRTLQRTRTSRHPRTPSRTSGRHPSIFSRNLSGAIPISMTLSYPRFAVDLSRALRARAV